MVGLVVATHGRLAEELVSTAEQIVGKLPAVVTCAIEPGASPEEIRERLCAAIASVDQGQGVVVLADLFGGSPCTQALTLCGKRPLEVVTGVNLPILLKAGSLREEGLPLPELAETLAQYGRKNITCATALLRAAGAERPHS
ncbi:MAG: PTS sugar transporter subunit IIA [Myxococcota bacterium]